MEKKNEVKIIEETVVKGNKTNKKKVAIIAGAALTAVAGVGIGIYKVLSGKAIQEDNSTETNE